MTNNSVRFNDAKMASLNDSGGTKLSLGRREKLS
jgi:hypothetical protein